MTQLDMFKESPMRKPHTEGVRIKPHRRWVTEYDGRQRNRIAATRGRGQRPTWEHDDDNMRDAIRELERARTELRLAHGEPEPRARHAAVKAALERVALAGRFLDELCVRRGVPCGDELPRSTGSSGGSLLEPRSSLSAVRRST